VVSTCGSKILFRDDFRPILQRIKLSDRLIPLNNYSDKILSILSVNVGACRSNAQPSVGVNS
jgi:hypothetical protein